MSDQDLLTLKLNFAVKLYRLVEYPKVVRQRR